MGLAEADDGFGTRDRAARRALTSSSRGSVAEGFRDSISGLRLRSGLLSADRQGTKSKVKSKASLLNYDREREQCSESR